MKKVKITAQKHLKMAEIEQKISKKEKIGLDERLEEHYNVLSEID